MSNETDILVTALMVFQSISSVAVPFIVLMIEQLLQRRK